MGIVDATLERYMTQFSGSYVGFFTAVSNVLTSLGNDWTAHADTTKNASAKSWGETFLKAAATVKQIAADLLKVRDEYELQSFKEKVNEITATKAQ